ncbi:(d)CMP kinase [Leptospira fletcheri]|uniref:Cytidylate kinase n=1 Tax=Leptospira fletcheri TaxID=2484981 RepID=A0A4V3JDJ9_9LEPT|nr:(d)CMP kinase [Leptospira fletcheri]TGK10235.1 (d)CMP kinase [Leptospira fletcheri]
MNDNVIALDGPAGSGKSTVARELATKLGYEYLDSGAFYRALTLYIFRKYEKENPSDHFQSWLEKNDPESLYSGAVVVCEFSKLGENRILLNGEDVSAEIRTPGITREIKHIASKGPYRDYVNVQLRNLALTHKLVMDGRDIGTAVFPDARYKFYLTASSRVRAERRHSQLKDQGIDSDLGEIEREIISRDRSDTEREIAPLKQAKDAILIDTDNLPKNSVIGKILECLDTAL